LPSRIFYLDRRKPGQGKTTSARKENDEFQIVSGIFEGKTLGSPICILIPNRDAKSKDYEYVKNTFRPSHADYTYTAKYGLRDYRGGGRSSARETVARVAAGSIAKQILAQHGISCMAYVSQVGMIRTEKSYENLDLHLTDSNEMRCPDPMVAEAMLAAVMNAKKAGDSLGGLITGLIQGLPAGIGEPIYGKLQAQLAFGMMSINAAHGFDYGSGFNAAAKLGSENNDAIYQEGEKILTRTNHAGGIVGGISNGMDVYFNVAFKPVASILQTQESVDANGNSISLHNEGRHDACVVPRAVPIVEAMAAITVLDLYLAQQMQKKMQ
jgi:chorismate synthase